MNDAELEALVEQRARELIAQRDGTTELHPERKAELNRGLQMLAASASDEGEGRMQSQAFRHGQLYATMPSTRGAALALGRDMGIETED
jgi:hypothetical protein